ANATWHGCGRQLWSVAHQETVKTLASRIRETSGRLPSPACLHETFVDLREPVPCGTWEHGEKHEDDDREKREVAEGEKGDHGFADEARPRSEPAEKNPHGAERD